MFLDYSTFCLNAPYRFYVPTDKAVEFGPKADLSTFTVK